MLDRKIVLVSNNRETLDGVRAYLQRAGANLSGTARLDDASAAATGADAVVLFADDYPRQAALDTATTLRQLLPRTLLVVVTDDVHAFTPASFARDGCSVVVLRRPAWGWMLVEAVRTRSPVVGGDS